MKVYTEKLVNVALDWVAAKCFAPNHMRYNNGRVQIKNMDNFIDFSPSTDRAQAEQLAGLNDSEKIHLFHRPEWPVDQCWSARPFDENKSPPMRGPSPMAAITRCYIASKMGMVPADLQLSDSAYETWLKGGEVEVPDDMWLLAIGEQHSVVKMKSAVKDLNGHDLDRAVAGAVSPAKTLTSDALDGQQLRLQAMKLLEQAHEKDGKSFCVVRHDHRHGTSIMPLWHAGELSDDEAAAILELDFEPDADETIEVEIWSLQDMFCVENTNPDNTLTDNDDDSAENAPKM